MTWIRADPEIVAGPGYLGAGGEFGLESFCIERLLIDSKRNNRGIF